MKDVPTWLPDGTILPCMLPREETEDVFISMKYKRIQDVPNGAVIGSSSLRRQAQLLAINPTFQVINFRGNVQTRLKKLNNGVADGTMLALAGLKRLQMKEVIDQAQILTHEEMLPAVAQGAIGIQCRSEDTTMLSYLAGLNSPTTKLCVDAERALLATLDGNCRTPIAAQARLISSANESKDLVITAMIAKPNGQDMIKVSLEGSSADPIALGKAAGEEIRRIAGDRFVEYQEAIQQAAAAANGSGTNNSTWKNLQS
jgi:hydroxymethylbilane synthase